MLLGEQKHEGMNTQ